MRCTSPCLVVGLILSALFAGCGGGSESAPTNAGMPTLLAGTTVASSFGVTAASGFLTVDSGSDLVFQVQQAGGDITSIRYNGKELQLPNDNSQLVSGIGATTSYTVSGGVAKITLTTPTLVQYLEAAFITGCDYPIDGGLMTLNT
jgi:hypothetical protein